MSRACDAKPVMIVVGPKENGPPGRIPRLRGPFADLRMDGRAVSIVSCQVSDFRYNLMPATSSCIHDTEQICVYQERFQESVERIDKRLATSHAPWL